MLTRREYEDLWETHFTNVGIRKNSKEDDNPNNCPTDYCDYLIREHMFEDYLDIFRGRDTRAIRHIQLCEEWYYPHPYFENNVCLIDTPALKYIMIGEAAPSKSGTYFYDINQINKTAWLSAPVKAFRYSKPTRIAYAKPTNSNEKINLLLELAKEGYLLIDLFPFAINYNNIRKNLIKEHESISISETFYKSIKSFIESNLNQLKKINTDITIAFSGPTKIHHFLAYKISLDPLLIPLGCRMFNYPNYFGAIIPTSPIILPLLFWIEWNIPNILNLRFHYVGINRVPFYRCCSFDPRNGTLHPPHELFIRNAFDLP